MQQMFTEVSCHPEVFEVARYSKTIISWISKYGESGSMPRVFTKVGRQLKTLEVAR
jgi:hypothetical protein